MNSKIFAAPILENIEKAVLAYLQGQKEFLSKEASSSPRAVGDILQSMIASQFKAILGRNAGKYSDDFARRSMADIAFTDLEEYYVLVDVKTHNLDTKFNMPNLTSVERLSRLYEDDKNYFSVLYISYKIVDSEFEVSNVHFMPIEHLSWRCLTIGALGWGQIQIVNSNNIDIDRGVSRKDWMIQLCDNLLEFYPREIAKINDRIAHFKKVREYWIAK